MGYRVLQVVTDPGRRGSQVFAEELERELAELGHSVETVAMRDVDSQARVDVKVLGTSRLAFVRGLRRRMTAADVVIAHGSHTLMGTAIAGLGVRTPVIYRQISDLTYWTRGPSRWLRVRWYVSRMSHVVSLWDGAASTLRRRFRVQGSSITVIPNAVDGRRFNRPTPEERANARASFGLPSTGLVCLYVGALVPEKGVELLVSVADRLPGTLLIVGAGPEEARLRSAADRLDGDKVRFASARADIQPAYWAADLLVLPSLGGDSMPAVIIEAAMCGLPAVATRIDGIVSMIEDGRTGILIDPSATSLVEGVEGAYTCLATMSPSAEAAARQRFDLSRVAQAWDEVIRDVISPAEVAAGRHQS